MVQHERWLKDYCYITDGNACIELVEVLLCIMQHSVMPEPVRSRPEIDSGNRSQVAIDLNCILQFFSYNLDV